MGIQGSYNRLSKVKKKLSIDFVILRKFFQKEYNVNKLYI